MAEVGDAVEGVVADAVTGTVGAVIAAAVNVARTSVGQLASRQIRNQKWPATMPQRQT